MTEHALVDEHFAGSNKLFISVWGWLIALTLVEIFLAYKPMPIKLMLIVCIMLLFAFVPDSFRSAGLRYKFKEQPPVAPEPVEEP